MAFGEHETYDHPVACAAPPIAHAACRALYAMSVCIHGRTEMSRSPWTVCHRRGAH